MTNPEVLDELERWANDHADSVTLAISCGKIRSLIADARELATLKARVSARWNLWATISTSRGCDNSATACETFWRAATMPSETALRIARELAAADQLARSKTTIDDEHRYRQFDIEAVATIIDRNLATLTADNERLTRERDKLHNEAQDYYNRLGTWQEATGCSHGDAAKRLINELTRERDELRSRLPTPAKLDHIEALLDLLHTANPAAFREIRAWLDELRSDTRTAPQPIEIDPEKTE